ncbi:hypothetical protein [Mesorhizobium sp. M0146]|uniref:DUF7666 domain-containing protein n=1 Tax=unclassified Mesorhizobium TaxID=325217 RepID=UPI00333A9DE1
MARKSDKSVALATYKGFTRDLTCTPDGKKFQYEVGKTYDNGGKSVTRCGDGAFHSVEMPLDAWSYYGPATGRFASTTASGDIAKGDAGDDTKVASAVITINAELRLPDFIRKSVAWIIEAAKESVTTGYRAHAASTGDYAHAASTGNGAHAASTGDYAHAASTGDYAHAASTGNGAHAASTGNGAHAASTGNGAIAAALGAKSTATAVAGGGIVLAAYDESVWPYKLVALRASLVGQNGIEAGKSYRLTIDGKFEQVQS